MTDNPSHAIAYDPSRFLVHRLPRFGKRAFDVIGAAALLIIAAPIFVVIAIGTRLTAGAPVLYRQSRHGLRGDRFTCLKFRTMRNGADAELEAMLADPDRAAHYNAHFKFKSDPRVTRFGRFLRFISMDELPQLWNVLRGDMSLIGPRPLIGPEVLSYGSNIETVWAVRPGLTGLWQVSGRSALPTERRVELDVEYVWRATPILDLWIITRTAWVLMRPWRSGAG